MTGMYPDSAELRRRFDDVMSGSELTELAHLFARVDRLGEWATSLEPGPLRPDLRRAPFHDVRTFRLRLELRGSDPVIWRCVDVPSDIPLEWLHAVVQTAFDWDDEHMHRFSVGGDPLDPGSQLFVCAHDELAAEELNSSTLDESLVRLDEVVQEVGDDLHYVFGLRDDGRPGGVWHVAIRLDDVADRGVTDEPFLVVDGRRAAPPPNSGGMVDGAELAKVLPDAALLDIERLNRAMQGSSGPVPLHTISLPSRLVELVGLLDTGRTGTDHRHRLATLIDDERERVTAGVEPSLVAVQWFLDRAADDGIELTQSGFLRPADVLQATVVVPRCWTGYGKNNREAHAPELLHFRRALQEAGLLRKYRGRLLLTRVGRECRTDTDVLWRQLVARLVPRAEGFARDATLLLLLHAATTVEDEISLAEVAAAMSEAGWHAGDAPIDGADLRDLAVLGLLGNITEETDAHLTRGFHLGPVASLLARDALRHRDDD